jgi:hypothetical protein
MKRDKTYKNKTGEKISKAKLLGNQNAMRKKAVIEAMKSQMGIVTKACRIANIERCTFYRWYAEDAEFKAAIDDVENIAVDFVEGKLYELIQDKNPAAIIFHLKCRGKKRGYYEKSQIEHSGQLNINAKVDFTKLTDDELRAIVAGQSLSSLGVEEEE